MKGLKQSKTLSYKFISVSLIMSVLLYVITMVCSGMIYSRVLEGGYSNLCDTVSRVISGSMDSDSINVWLNGEDTHGYVQATNRLEELMGGVPDLESIAVYQMRDDGMYTVYNTKSTHLRRDLGNVISYDAKWGKYKEDFLLGKPVDKIYVNGYYGKTMTYCAPIFDSNSKCVAYVCSGISMNSINKELFSFLRVFGIALFVIIAFMNIMIIFYIRIRVIDPVIKLGIAMRIPTRKGSVDYMRRLATNRCYSTSDMKHLFRSAARVFSEKNEINTMMRENQRDVMHAFATIINRSDIEAEDYSDNVAKSTEILCEQMRKHEKFADSLTPEFCKSLVLAAPLHDIGKLTVSDDIVYKPDKLTPEEFEIVKAHSENGAEIIERAKKNMPNKKYLDLACEVARHHHEHWDGSGYPSALKGEEISIASRIVSIVDAYDAITNICCYHSANTPERAYDILVSDEGFFDPDIIECFVEAKDKIIKLYS